MEIFSRLFGNNPALDHINRRALRRLRAWGWLLIALPIGLAGIHVVVEAFWTWIHSQNFGDQRLPSAFSISATLGGLLLWSWCLLECIFSLGAIHKLVRPQNLEELLMTPIHPAQFWAAAWVNINRQMLLAAGFALPLLGGFVWMAEQSMGAFALRVLMAWTQLNVWALLFMAIAAVRGLRAHGILMLGLAILYTLLTGPLFAGFMEYGEGMSWILLIHPIALLPEAFDALRGASPGHAAVRFFAMELPYWFSAIAVLALLIALGAITLLAGPRRVPEPLTPELFDRALGLAPGLGRFRRTFAKTSIAQSAWRASRKLPLWREIYESLQTNPLGWPRRPARARLFASLILWTLLAAVPLDWSLFIAQGMGRPFNYSKLDAQTQELMLLGFMFLSTLATLHFAYGRWRENGDTLEPAPISLRREWAIYLTRAGIVLALVWLTGAIFEIHSEVETGLNYAWILHGLPALALVLAFAVIGAQIAFQLWVSSRALHRREAMVAGLTHFVGLWAGPLLALAVMNVLPASVARVFGEVASLSPVVMILDLFEDMYFTYSQDLQWDGRWETAAAFATLEILFFGSMAVLDSRRARRDQRLSREVETPVALDDDQERVA